MKLVVHYQRPASDYTGWNLWLWKNSSVNTNDKSIDSKGVPFNGDDSFGKVLTLEVPDMKNFEDIGIIVRLNDWAEKDIGSDRFISVFDANGKAEVWLRKGDPEIHYSLPTEPIKANPAIAQAKLYDSLEFTKKYTYKGSDLGNTYSKAKTAFRVWAPTATKVSLVTYASADTPTGQGVASAMVASINGTWTAFISGDTVSSFVVIHNPNATAQMVKLPKAGKWSIVVSGDKAGTKVISSGTMSEVSVAGQSTMVLQQ